MRTTDVPRGRSIFPSPRKNHVKSAFALGEFAHENSAKVGWSRFSRRHILPPAGLTPAPRPVYTDFLRWACFYARVPRFIPRVAPSGRRLEFAN
jgi:hypothetical protein